MGGQYSIENTKEILKLAFAGGKAYKGAIEDGKIDLLDLNHVISVAPHIKPAIDDINLVPKEVGELDAEERKELLEFTAKELGEVFNEAKLIDKINKGLKAVFANIEFYQALKA